MVADVTQILERFGPDSSGAIYYVLRVGQRGHRDGHGEKRGPLLGNAAVRMCR